MKKIIVAAALLATGCSKNINYKEPTCQFASLLSDKYTLDSVFVRTDTLWGKKGDYAYMCGKELDSIKANPTQWFLNCDLNMIECLRYTFKP